MPSCLENQWWKILLFELMRFIAFNIPDDDANNDTLHGINNHVIYERPSSQGNSKSEYYSDESDCSFHGSDNVSENMNPKSAFITNIFNH